MSNFLTPPAFKAEQTGPEADAKYRRLRWQVFIGIFIGYAGFYIVRKNFSMAIPALAPFGFDKGELGIVLSMNAMASPSSSWLLSATVATRVFSCLSVWCVQQFPCCS